MDLNVAYDEVTRLCVGAARGSSTITDLVLVTLAGR